MTPERSTAALTLLRQLREREHASRKEWRTDHHPDLGLPGTSTSARHPV
jgi:hypothetical protein